MILFYILSLLLFALGVYIAREAEWSWFGSAIMGAIISFSYLILRVV